MTSIELTSANFLNADAYLKVTHPLDYRISMCDEENNTFNDTGLPLANPTLDNNDPFWIDSFLFFELDISQNVGKKRRGCSSTSDSPCKRFKSE